MPAALDRLAELHDSRWSEESSFLEGWKRFRAAAIAGAASDSVIIHELVSAEGDVIATELDLLSGNSLAFYQAGRRTEREWRGSGSVLRADILQWACSQGFAEYDLLRGDESYKADWSDTQRQVVRCRMGVGPRGVSLIQAARAQKGLRAGATRCEAIAKKLLSRGPLKSRHEAHSEQSD
jgi:CelD/BcsL family acetyltransferase involved in cellulose biosynthesis